MVGGILGGQGEEGGGGGAWDGSSKAEVVSY